MSFTFRSLVLFIKYISIVSSVSVHVRVNKIAFHLKKKKKFAAL